MRFPLPSTTFPSVKVSSDQAAQFATTCERIVDSTLASRGEYVHRCERRLKPSAWRLVKRRRVARKCDLEVYQPHKNARVTRPSISVSCSPVLIGVGFMEGSLDEVMLGLTASTTGAMQVVTSTVYKDVADARMLARLDTPNEDEPFAFLGFKWLVKVPSLKLTALARPRDFIYLESTGVREHEGQRFGYQMMHSVELSNCPSLPMGYGIVRGTMSFCFVFAEDVANQRVEVFCKGFVDPRGGLARSITLSTAANVILDCSNALECARRKKLQWSLRQDLDDALTRQQLLSREEAEEDNVTDASTSSPPLSPRVEKNRASGCDGCRSGRRRSTVTSWASASCSICGDRVCSQCRHQVMLPNARQNELSTCCSSCLERTETIDAAAFARELTQRAMQFDPPPAVLLALENANAVARHKIRLAPIEKRPVRRYTIGALV